MSSDAYNYILSHESNLQALVILNSLDTPAKNVWGLLLLISYRYQFETRDTEFPLHPGMKYFVSHVVYRAGIPTCISFSMNSKCRQMRQVMEMKVHSQHSDQQHPLASSPLLQRLIPHPRL